MRSKLLDRLWESEGLNECGKDSIMSKLICSAVLLGPLVVFLIIVLCIKGGL